MLFGNDSGWVLSSKIFALDVAPQKVRKGCLCPTSESMMLAGSNDIQSREESDVIINLCHHSCMWHLLTDFRIRWLATDNHQWKITCTHTAFVAVESRQIRKNIWFGQVRSII